VNCFFFRANEINKDEAGMYVKSRLLHRYFHRCCRDSTIVRNSSWHRTISAAVEPRNCYRTSIVS